MKKNSIIFLKKSGRNRSEYPVKNTDYSNSAVACMFMYIAEGSHDAGEKEKLIN